MSAAHPQSRIDELTLQNRTLSHTIQKLKNELSNEQGRFHTSMTDLQTKWQSEKDQWTEMQHCYRIHQLKLVVQLEELRVVLEKQKEEIRKLTLQKATKEAEVVLAQGKVTDLKWTMEGLEEELKDAKGDTEDAEEALVGQYQAAIEKLKRKCKEFADETKEKTTELEEAQKERDELESQLSSLKSQHAKLSATLTTNTTQLERTSLQLETAHTSITDLMRQTNELERANATIKRQLDKWQSLENKGEVQANGERKRRLELEAQVKELEEKLEEKVEVEKLLEKEKRRVAKQKSVVEEWQKEIEVAQKERQEAETEVEAAKKQQEKLQKQLEKLKAQLMEERAKKAPASKKTAKEPDDDSESEHEREPTPPPPADDPNPSKRAKPKSKVNPKATAKPSKPARKARKATGPEDNQSEVVESGANEGESENESEVETGEKKEKPKPKPKEKARTEKGKDTDGGTKQQNGGGRPESRRATSEARVVNDVGNAKRTRAPSRAEAQEEAGDDEGVAAKKKKRKINLFPVTQPAAMPWIQIAQGTGGLDIPTALSPVKESDASAQPGGLLGRVGSVLGNLGRR